MLLAQVEAFLEVARLGNVSRAAEALYVTQPSLTARLKNLEAELGEQLFLRTGRGLRLTEAGRAFLPHAERALRSLREGEAAVTELHHGPEVESVPVYEDHLVLVVPPGHRLAGGAGIRLEDLDTEPLILFDRTSSYHELTNALFREAGVLPSTVMELDNIEAAKQMVAHGLGVALLPHTAVTTEVAAGTLTEVRIAGAATVRRQIVAIHRRDGATALARRFLSM